MTYSSGNIIQSLYSFNLNLKKIQSLLKKRLMILIKEWIKFSDIRQMRIKILDKSLKLQTYEVTLWRV